MRKILRSFAIASLLGVPAAHADTLLIEVIQREQLQELQRPARGASMGQVEAVFGAPEQRIAAVGEPPISRWVYSDFTVVFEHDRVLHSVPRR